LSPKVVYFDVRFPKVLAKASLDIFLVKLPAASLSKLFLAQWDNEF